MNYITLDIETQELVQDWSKPWEAGLACCCILDNIGLKIFGPNDIEALGLYLQQTKDHLLVTWNGDAFDIPFLRGLGIVVEQESCDPAALLRGVVGKRCSLDNTSRSTLGQGKIGHGHSAPQLWKEGDLARLHAYCAHDAKLTEQLFLFARQYGYLVVDDRTVPIRVPGCVAGPREVCDPPSKEPATDKQIAYLQRLLAPRSWYPTPGFTKAHAAEMIEKLKAK